MSIAIANLQSTRSEHLLHAMDKRFSESTHMLRAQLQGRSYHSALGQGAWVHETRESLQYALLLLREGSSHRVCRAKEIIRQVLSLQSTDPNAATCGVWPYYLEESLDRMSLPDWNWADFCGAALASILADYELLLGAGLSGAIRDSLGHAAWSILRRNVHPSYTNIAVMGGVVVAAAGELLGEPRLLAYGRDKLRGVVEHVEQNGGFAEYNSPTYTMVTLVETERALQLLSDPPTRAAAESLRQSCWELIASHFHPPTRQWSGPHARTYADLLSPSTQSQLEHRVRMATPDDLAADDTPDAISAAGVRMLPCPNRLRPRFSQLQSGDRVSSDCFVRGPEGTERIVGTTWMHSEVTLGSVNEGELWTQRRPLIGYIATDVDPAVVLRVRLLKDGQDFASGYLRTAQRRNRALCLLTLLADAGDFHLHIDRPKDGAFKARDLRLQIELRGKGVLVDTAQHDTLGLRAGDWRVAVHLPDVNGTFAGRNPRWQCRQLADLAVAEAVILEDVDETIRIDTPADRHWLAFGLELVRIDQPPTRAGITSNIASDGDVSIAWSLDPPMTLEAASTMGRRIV